MMDEPDYPIVDTYSIKAAVKMLNEHLAADNDDLEPLVSVLEALSEEPENEELLSRLSQTYDGLGVLQGAVLTYAPCISILISENPFNDPD